MPVIRAIKTTYLESILIFVIKSRVPLRFKSQQLRSGINLGRRPLGWTRCFKRVLRLFFKGFMICGRCMDFSIIQRRLFFVFVRWSNHTGSCCVWTGRPSIKQSWRFVLACIRKLKHRHKLACVDFGVHSPFFNGKTRVRSSHFRLWTAPTPPRIE